MDIVPLLQKDYVEKNKKRVEIGIRVPKKNKQESWFNPLEIEKKIPQCPDKVTCTLKGAGWGGCFGLTLGGTGMYCYSQVDFCLWLCCLNYHFTPVKILNEIMLYGLPICTCAGCVTGACCVVTGLSKRMKIDEWFT
jgi:hypothetical protein